MSSYSKHKDDQASFLQRKKEEILARKNKSNLAAPVKPSVTSTPTPTTSQTKVTGPAVPFVNDGSFLERFKAMQQQMKSSSASNESKDQIKIESQQSSSMKSPMTYNVKTEPQSPPHLTPSKQSFVLKKPAAIFENEVEEVISSDYDVAKQLAERVVAEGLHVEQEARQTFQQTGDSRYRFLFDTSNPVAKYYQTELKTFKQSNLKKRKWDDSQTATSSTSVSLSQQQQQQQSSSTGDNVDIKSEFEKAKALVRAKAAALMSGQAPSMVSEEDKKRQKDIEEQRMMQEIYRKVIAQQAAAVQSKSKSKKRREDKPKYEYDSDEDIDGGTWEHKKRDEEMRKTQEWAMDLTSNAKGKHHLSDFLPADELEKFMEKVQAVREGREADFSDYSKYRIQADNIGFKMLQKAGWKEGEGLGANREGITQPINKGKTSFDQAGVGMEKPAEVKKDDDDFELYRKRMMLAYKFRPNPLNNPRRPYY